MKTSRNGRSANKLWLSGGFGMIGLWHLVMAFMGWTVSFPTIGLTLTKELHVLVFVMCSILSFGLYQLARS